MEVASSEFADTKSTSSIKSKPRPRPFVSLIDRLKSRISLGDIFNRIFHAFVGVLKEIDLNRCRVLVTIPNLNREIWVPYPQNLENFLLQNRGNLVEFQGAIMLDKKEMPFRVNSIESARLADDSNIRVSDVLPANLRVKSLPDQFVKVDLSDDKQTYYAEYKPLRSSCYAHTRYDLEETLRSEFEFLWKYYAIENDKVLSVDAIELKQKLLDMFVEVEYDIKT